MKEERLTTARFPPSQLLFFFNTSLCCFRLEKNLTQVWIPPRLSHSLYHTSALLEEKRKTYLVIIFSSFTLYICKEECVTPESMV